MYIFSSKINSFISRISSFKISSLYNLFVLILFSLILQFAECVIIYVKDLNSTIFNPFIQSIWGWLFLYGVMLFAGGKIAKILISIILILQIFTTILVSFFAWKFALPLSGDAVFVLKESSWTEVKTFIVSFVSWDVLISLLLSCSVTVSVLRYFFQGKLNRSIPLFCLAGVLIAPQAINTIRFSIRGDYKDIYKRNNLSFFIATWFHSAKELSSLKEMVKNPKLPEKITRLGKENKFLTVLIIGESATRFHHSIYDYPRKTSPQMESLKENLLIFDDVVSGYAHTAQALRFILSTEELEHRNDFRYTLFDVFKKAGFEILHYSNQARWGGGDSPTTLLTLKADKKLFLTEKKANAYDLEMLQDMEKNLSNIQTPTLLVFHLMGSHLRFEDRTPDELKIFNSGNRPKFVKKVDSYEAIDEYDNSILYTDIFLGKIAEYLKKINYPACFIYLSDHGESPENIKSKPRSGASKLPDCYEIPFMFFANDNYKEAYNDFWKQAEKNQHLPYQTDWATYSIFSGAQISFEHFPYEKDIFSNKFKPKKKRILGHSKVEYNSRSNPYKM